MPELHYLTLTDPHELARPRHLAYWEWGDPGNAKIAFCSHGLSRNARDFDALAQSLSTRFRVICPDMAGRGKSSWLVNKSDYNYSLYVSDSLAVLDHLKAGNVAWVGTSMGGIIGMMIAAVHKPRISSLVLNDIGAIVSAEGLRRILGYVGIGGGSAFENKDAAMKTLRTILAPFNITSEEQWQYMFNVSMLPLADGRYAFAYDPGINQPLRDAVSKPEGISDIDLTGFWNAVACPTLIIRGERSDILSLKTAEEMLKKQPPVELTQIPGTGHAPALLDPQQIHMIHEWVTKYSA